MRRHRILQLLIAAAATTSFAEVDFNRDIRPILSDQCYQCHGPDANSRKAGLRLDIREDAVKSAIKPGDPNASELILRVEHTDPDERMPPPSIHKRVTPEQAAKLREWIADGAEYAQHWAYEPVKKSPVPDAGGDWARNEIDRFIFQRLKGEGMKPSAAADPRTLLRRLTLDLTGLPPTPEEVAAFVADPNLEAAVDRLMKSERYGEHMAWRWLDAARYADSDGYESDPLRNMWPWRDWVVESYNRHMPYDQFLIEQLAGDDLQNPDMRQILATGFNRNHRINNEGGIDPAEWLVEYVADRAETTATVFMGLTWQCARCHDHKFDPISQKDYFQLFAFFHQLPEIGNGRGSSNAPPMMDVSALPHLEEFEKLRAELEPLEAELKKVGASPEFKKAQTAWIESLKTDEETRKKLPGNLAKTEIAKWDGKLKEQARVHYLNNLYKPAGELRAKMRPLEKRDAELKRTGSKVMVMGDMDEPRKTHILDRGAFDKPTTEVFRNTPSFLPPKHESLPNNRLGLAQWLVDPGHPLTARVAVNREWERFFGIGLVKTGEDFGSQGELPSHPQLLDFLAAKFVESGWNVQALQKMIVTSATYRQSSVMTPQLLEQDPDNRLLARGPRYRLPAAVIRDQALAASGLFVGDVGGPPVKPYQPAGLWKEIIKGRVEYKRDTGEKLYRRSIYTLWRRAVKPPLMMLLDANGRDTCAVDMKQTNTPLQALLLMNDVTFVEHARGLGSRMIAEGGDSDASKIEHGMMLLLGRAPSKEETAILMSELESQRQLFAADEASTQQLLKIGEFNAGEAFQTTELAAFASVARVMLNMDETLTKE
ncbi:MAG: PSD1 and planctomycete cytochrome C domain-containing protein, partial [Verrucomicrobiota bacterium]